MNVPRFSWSKTPRAIITLVFFAFGAAVGVWAGTVPRVIHAANVDDMALGIGLTAYTIAYVLAMTVGPKLARWTTNRAILAIMLPLVAVSFLALMASATPALFFALLVCFGALLGLTDLFMNAEASAIEAEMSRPIFASLHGIASLGVACFAIIGSLIATASTPLVAGLLAALLLLFSAVIVRRHLPARRPALAAAPLQSSSTEIFPFILLGLAAGLVIAGETAAIMWSAKLLDEQAAWLAAIAGMGVAFFGLCHASVRFLGDRLRVQFGDAPLMMGSLAVAALGFAIIGLSNGFVMSVLAFALIGFGTACVIPCIFALASRLSAADRAKGIGLISLVAGVPRTLAPWLFGWLAETHSTSFAFAMCALGMLAALVMVVAIRKLVTEVRVTASSRHRTSP